MSTDVQFLGGMRATKSISSHLTASGCTFFSGVDLNIVYSGLLTAGALSTVLSRTNSSGFLHNFMAFGGDATTRDMRLQITIDGVVVFDQTTSAGQVGKGFLISGQRTEASGLSLPPLTWTNSILIKWSSSITETGKFYAQYMFEELQ